MPGTSSQRNGCQDTPSRTQRAIHLYSQTSSIRRQPRQPHRAPSSNLFNPPLKPSAYSPPRSTCHEFRSPLALWDAWNDRVNKTQFEQEIIATESPVSKSFEKFRLCVSLFPVYYHRVNTFEGILSLLYYRYTSRSCCCKRQHGVASMHVYL